MKFGRIKLDLGQKILLAVYALCMIWLLTDVFIKKDASKQNATIVKGHFEKIEKQKPRRKGGYSYNIYIKESQDFYKVAAKDVSMKEAVLTRSLFRSLLQEVYCF